MISPRPRKWIAALVSALAVGSATATPLSLTYSIAPGGPGVFTYDFKLTLVNQDGSWVVGQNFNWIVFGDGYPASVLPDFVGDPGRLPVGPFTAFTTTGGGNNGPTFLNLTPSPETGGWVPNSIGESLTWSGRSANYVAQGNMLFSNLQGSNPNPAYFEVAVMVPVPEPSGALVLVVGLWVVGHIAKRHRKTATAIFV